MGTVGGQAGRVKGRYLIRTGTRLFAMLTLGAPLPAAMAADPADPRIEALEARVETLERQNRELADMLRALTRGDSAAGKPADAQPVRSATANVPPVASGEPRRAGSASFVGLDPAYSFAILDDAENVTTKPLVQLLTKQAGGLSDTLTLSGGITVIADYQVSNSDSKFGYLTRHPTATNQIGKRVSEAVIHSAQLAMTARLTDDLTGFVELLYDPETSFGSGTLTDLNRNQIQLRRGWLMWGNLDRRPVYALIGKTDISFGLNDTVSPFTPSTNYHAFAGLSYGAQLGYYANGLHLRAMAVQGGAQFRSANTPVEGTAVPSRLNNFALDANYTFQPWGGTSLMLGGSYQHGTAYCQDYPVVHFNPCRDNVPAFALYGRARLGGLTLLGEYAQTTKVWRGSAVPASDPRLGRTVAPPQVVWSVSPNPLSIYPAVRPRSFTAGARYAFGAPVASTQERATAVSLEFSRFISGADGSPWEGQSQTVLGLSHFLSPSINLFGELVYVDGFVPLNFLSGGNFANGSSWSDQSVDTGVALIGARAAF